MTWRALLCSLVLTAGCGLGDDDASAKGKVAAGAPRYIAGTLSVTAAAATAPAADDFGDDAGQAHAMTVGDPISGRLEQPSDTDWFAVPLRTGEAYQVLLSGFGAVRVSVLDPDGVVVAKGPAGETSVTAARDGTYFVRVEALAGRDLFYGLEIAARP